MYYEYRISGLSFGIVPIIYFMQLDTIVYCSRQIGIIVM